MKTRAAVLYEMGLDPPYSKSQPLKIEEVDLSPPGNGEILVRVRAAGVCHSDLSVINGDRPRPTPMVLGHEAAGEVEILGDGVNDLEVGDHVVTVFVPSCGRCLPCNVGRPSLCEPGNAANGTGVLLSGSRRFHLEDYEINHHLGVSAFSEYAVVSRQSVVRIELDIPLEEAALFGCAVLTGVGAVVNTAAVPPGSTVAVIGLGGVGLNAILGANLVGARRVVGIDKLDRKLALARELGATDTFSAEDEHCIDQVREVTRGGVDYAFETAGSVKALEVAYSVTKSGGVTVTAGLDHPDRQFSVQQVSLVAEERTVKGSYLGSCVPSRDLPRFISLYRQGRLPVDKLISKRITLNELNTALDQLASGEAVRQMIVF